MKRILLACLAALALAAAPPRRVVSHAVGTDDLLLAVADPAQVAALSHLSRNTNFSVARKEPARFPALRDSEAESILRFQPDLVLVTSYSRPEVISLLKRAKVPMLNFDRFESLEDAYGNLRALGKALGREAQAERAIAESQGRVAELQRRLQGAKPVRVLSVGFYPFTAGTDTTFDDICRHAGALNVAQELKGHQPTPAEKVITWNPEVLVGPSDEDGKNLLAYLRATPPYKFIPAAKAGRVVTLPGSLLSSVTHTRIEAYERLARALHPERFR